MEKKAMEKLASYDNGNTHVVIYNDGTKERTYSGVPNVVHPESIDVKITNHCEPTINSPICSYCHEQSSPGGSHADLDELANTLSILPAGVEIALGGGNPLSHPDLMPFLYKLNAQGLIVNMTINQKHLAGYKEMILSLISKQLIRGVGISYSSSRYLDDIKPILAASPNVVFHVIMGINKVGDVGALYKFCGDNGRDCKILVLGYKQFGFGVNYYLKNASVEEEKYNWYTKLAPYFKKENLVVSFDNLAIAQLKLRRYFTDEAWGNFFMGNDFEFSMYIDGVKQHYAKSSTSANRVSFKNSSLLSFFRPLSDS